MIMLILGIRGTNVTVWRSLYMVGTNYCFHELAVTKMNQTRATQERSMGLERASKLVAGKRRGLTDITNVKVEEDKGAGVSKKPVMLDSRPHAQAQDISNVELKKDERVYMDRPVDDIDSRDCKNPLQVSEYAHSMYIHFNEVEEIFRVSPHYMDRQDFINPKMRCILADWLVEVHLKFKLLPESLYMMVNIVDRYLEKKQVRRSKLQLVGVTALLIAAKYEEIYPPLLEDVEFITDRAYLKDEILCMESEIVSALKWELTVPTAHSFLCRYLKAAHADRTIMQLACYLAERTLQEHTMLRFLPSTIAATAVMVARKSLNRHAWSPTLLHYTRLDECDLSECAEEMRATMQAVSQDPAGQQQRAVYCKYASAKLGGVARLPLVF